MLLIHLIKIVFWVLIIRHLIKWVSYHIRNDNKKARVFHGNTRMPKELEFALMYGCFAKRKKRFKDLSYRKSLKEWMQLVNSRYPPDNLNFTPQPCSNIIDRNWKQKPFPKLKTVNNNFSARRIHLLFLRKGQSYVGGRGGQFLTIHKTSDTNTKISHFKNFKISKNTIPFPI